MELLSHEKLLKEAQVQATKSNNNSSADRHISQATVYLIESNARAEESIDDFSKASAEQSSSNKRLAVSQIIFAIA